jgi:hypothetical protein
MESNAHFILIASASESIDGETISPIDMANRRLSTNSWGLWSNTPHRNDIKAGDSVLVYVAGAAGKKFVASAIVESVGNNPKSYIGDGDALSDIPVKILNLKEVTWFRNEVSILDLKNSLDFIPKNTNKWGCVLQRGARKISPKDAGLILKNSL